LLKRYTQEESPEKRFTLDMAVTSGKDKGGLENLSSPLERPQELAPLLPSFI